MKITHCIQELTHLLGEDGDLEVESVAISKETLNLKIKDVWYEFEQYKKNK